jgi:hypothetical protein
MIAAGLAAAPFALMVLLVGRPPYLTQEARPVLHEIARRRQPNDAFYAYCRARHAMEFYGRRAGFDAWTQGRCHDDDVRGYLREVDALRGQPRLWFFFTQSHDDQTLVIRSYLRTIGHVRDSVPDPTGAHDDIETAGFLFDLSDPTRLARSTADSFVIPSGSEGSPSGKVKP